VTKIAVIPGDGIGPEVCSSAQEVVRSAVELAGGRIEFHSYPGGAETFLETGSALPEETLNGCRRADAVLHGAAGLPNVNYPDGTEAGQDFSMKIRAELDLYANIRPVKSWQGVPPSLNCASGTIDYVIVRENTEGLYSARSGGNVIRDEIATDTMIVSRRGVERICRKAADIALHRSGALSDGKRRVTVVDKANVLRSYAFFRRVALEVLEDYEGIEVECLLVDAAAAQMVQTPEHFDVVVTENIFGDIISDLGAATVGGLGLAPSGEVGTEYGYFQGIHGSAPSIAGRNIANPIATILSGAQMLDWLSNRNDNASFREASRAIEKSVAHVLAEGTFLTADLGGSSSTSDCTQAIVQGLRVPSGDGLIASE